MLKAVHANKNTNVLLVFSIGFWVWLLLLIYRRKIHEDITVNDYLSFPENKTIFFIETNPKSGFTPS
ncbi:MAG: hypothetical protein AAF491_00620, partial [Verrucomicrobiota bacterium]